MTRSDKLKSRAKVLSRPKKVRKRLTAERSARLKVVRADGTDRNPRLDASLEDARAGDRIVLVERPEGATGWVRLSKRWVVGRTFAGLGRYRRNSRDYERYTDSSEAMRKISSIHHMLRLLRPNEIRKAAPFKYRESPGNITGSKRLAALGRRVLALPTPVLPHQGAGEMPPLLFPGERAIGSLPPWWGRVRVGAWRGKTFVHLRPLANRS
jgi:hypothetical protein